MSLELAALIFRDDYADCAQMFAWPIEVVALVLVVAEFMRPRFRDRFDQLASGDRAGNAATWLVLAALATVVGVTLLPLLIPIVGDVLGAFGSALLDLQFRNPILNAVHRAFVTVLGVGLGAALVLGSGAILCGALLAGLYAVERIISFGPRRSPALRMALFLAVLAFALESYQFAVLLTEGSSCPRCG